VIEEVSIDGHETPPGPIARTVGRANLLFRFTAPTFVAPTRVQFRYRLEGLDDAWSVAGFGREVSYHAVPPGDYVFRLRASDGYGRWAAQAAALPVRLRPVFYRTRAFAVACALGLALAALGVHRLRVGRMRASFALVQQERLRLARELHDGLGQGFSAVTFHLEALKRTMAAGSVEQSRAILERARALVDHCHAQARAAIWDLRAADTVEPRLTARLESIARAQVADLAAGAPEVTVREEGAPIATPAMVRHEVEQVVREAVGNAVRHGQPGRIDIQVAGDDGTLRISVADDGRGFDTAAADPAAPGHFGLIGMHERARRLGGVLRIQSAPGEGTRLVLEVPRRVAPTESPR